MRVTETDGNYELVFCSQKTLQELRMLSTLDCQVTMIIVIVGADDLARLIINFFIQI